MAGTAAVSSARKIRMTHHVASVVPSRLPCDLALFGEHLGQPGGPAAGASSTHDKLSMPQ